VKCELPLTPAPSGTILFWRCSLLALHLHLPPPTPMGNISRLSLRSDPIEYQALDVIYRMLSALCSLGSRSAQVAGNESPLSGRRDALVSFRGHHQHNTRRDTGMICPPAAAGPRVSRLDSHLAAHGSQDSNPQSETHHLDVDMSLFASLPVELLLLPAAIRSLS
jgi:hypothetical protein